MRVVDYLRQSRESKQSTPERQRETCEGYAKSQGWLISKEYADIGWKRSEDTTRPAWQALLADAQSRLFDVVLCEEQSRMAAADHYAWSGYMQHFRQCGVRVIEARTGRVLNPSGTDFAGSVSSAIGGILNTQELVDKSTRGVSGKLSGIKAHGTWQGGPIAYGTSIGCFTPAGVLLWSCEPDKGRYRQSYADGRILYRDYFPKDRGDTDLLLIQPSKFPDRIEAIVLLFQLYSQGIGTNNVAAMLNKAGYRLPDGKLFYSTFIRTMVIRGVVFTGYMAWGKVSASKYSRPNVIEPTGYALVDNPDGYTERPESEWTYSKQLFEPIISRDTWLACRNILADRRQQVQPRCEQAVYSRILICGNCGKPMLFWATVQHGIQYKCATYHKYGRENIPGCGVGQVKQSIIDGHVGRWLEDTHQCLSFAVDESPIQALYAQQANLSQPRAELRKAVESYLYEKLALMYEYRQVGETRIYSVDGKAIKFPNPTCSPVILQNLLTTIEALDKRESRASLEALRAEKQRLTDLFTETRNKSIRLSILGKVDALESEISELETSQPRLTKQHFAIQSQVCALYRAIHAARLLAVDELAQRQQAVRKIIGEIRVEFRWVVRGGRSCWVPDKITIGPQLGEAVVYSQPADTAHRHGVAVLRALTITYQV